MADKKQSTVVAVVEIDPEAEATSAHVQPSEVDYHVPKVHDFSASSGQSVRKSTWDKNDKSHEGIRRPGLRLKKGLPPEPSRRDILKAKEGKLQQEKIDRRKVLAKTLAESEVETQLEAEFQEREDQLESEWNDYIGF